MSTNEPVHFAGLPNWAKITIVFSALLLGVLSIGFAWKDASDSNKTLAFGQKDVEVIRAVAKLGQTGTGNDQGLVVHTLNAIIHLKAITNHQALAGLAIGAGSAFLAIGFALFLLGADGAFRIQLAGKSDGKIAFYATAPGLLCFLLSAILIMIGATRKHEIQLGDFNLTVDKEISQQEAMGNADRSKFLQDEPKVIPQSSLTTAFRQTLLTAHICIDRLLTRDIQHSKPVRSVTIGGGRSSAVFLFRKVWINGATLRVKFLDGDLALQTKVKKFAEQWTQHANIQFAFGSSADAEIRISFKEPGLWSYIGTDALDVPKHSPTMSLGGITNETNDTHIRSIVLHEFGHALGFSHEFQPPAGNIKWDRQFIHQFFAQLPNQWSPAISDRYFIHKYNNAQIRGSDFDPKSIMVMGIPKEFTLNGFQIQWNQELSDKDKMYIASTYSYPKTGK